MTPQAIQKAFIHIHTLSVSWLYALGFWKTATVMLIFTFLLIWSLKDESEDESERRPS